MVLGKSLILTNGRNTIRLLNTTSVLAHNPAGLKKKQNTQLDQKKLQRQRQLEDAKLWKQVVQVPVDPDSVVRQEWRESSRQRVVTLTEEESEERMLIKKEWSRYRMQQHKLFLKQTRDKQRVRENAMRELRKESQFLYNAALEVDKQMFPLVLKGAMETPPINGYEAPDFVDAMIEY